MVIEVELFGQLAQGRQRLQTLTLERPLTVQEVAGLLGLNPVNVGLIAINGIQSELEDLVLPNCRLCFFPPMSGG